MAEHTPKVDPMAKVVGFVSALAVLVAALYLVGSLFGRIDNIGVSDDALVGTPTEPVAESAPESAPAAPAEEEQAEAEPAPVTEETVEEAVETVADTSGDVAAGEQKYASCAACHGADGGGQGGAFPSMHNLGFESVQASLTAYRDGDDDTLAAMGLGSRAAQMTPNAAGLSDEDIADLAAYIEDEFGAAEEAAADEAAADTAEAAAAEPKERIISTSTIQRGEALYSNCMICHGDQGEGNAMFRSPALAGMELDSVESLLKVYREGQEMGPNSSVMIAQAVHLSDEDIFALSAYIATMETDED